MSDLKVRITQTPPSVTAPGAYWAGSLTAGVGDIVIDFLGIESEPDLTEEEKKRILKGYIEHEIGHALQEFFGLPLIDPLEDGICGGYDPKKSVMVIVPLDEHEKIVAEKDRQLRRLRKTNHSLNRRCQLAEAAATYAKRYPNRMKT
jgi:hypothetical protein